MWKPPGLPLFIVIHLFLKGSETRSSGFPLSLSSLGSDSAPKLLPREVMLSSSLSLPCKSGL